MIRPLPGAKIEDNVTTRQGMTLLEVLLVMLLLMIVMSIAVPSAQSWRRHAELTGASDRFRAKHALARATAVQLRRTTRLQIDPAGRKLWVEVDRTATSRDTVGAVDYFEGPVQIASNRNTLCFDARGLAKPAGGGCQAGDAQVVYSLSGRADTVRTSPLGRVLR
jgi:Tfp pilus assembly protein FimT